MFSVQQCHTNAQCAERYDTFKGSIEETALQNIQSKVEGDWRNNKLRW